MSAIVDYQHHRLVVARDLPPGPPADVELPMRFHRLAMVRGVLNGSVQKSFIVDTGGEVISISLSTANALGMVPVRHIPLRVYGTSGWDDDAFLLPGVNLGFDRIRFDNLAVVVLNLHRPSALLGFHIGGIIGHTFLGDYRVALDLQDSVLRLSEIRALRLTEIQSVRQRGRLEVVADPDRHAHLAEVVTAAQESGELRLGREDGVFPLAVEERRPGPVEMDRKADGERRETEAVRGSRVVETEPADRDGRTEDRLRGPSFHVRQVVGPVPDDGPRTHSSPLDHRFQGCPAMAAAPMLKKKVPLMPPRIPMGVAIASTSGNRSSTLPKNALWPRKCR